MDWNYIGYVLLACVAFKAICFGSDFSFWQWYKHRSLYWDWYDNREKFNPDREKRRLKQRLDDD